MSALDHWRQSDIVTPKDLGIPIIIIGAGGIGSPTALALAKMGCQNITVYDDDKVEPHNLPNQMYRVSDLEKFKVDALAEICKDYADVNIKTEQRRVAYDEVTGMNGIVVCAVDSMEVRHELWKGAKYNVSIKLYIDSRMSSEFSRTYSLNPTIPSSISKYEATLVSPDKVLPMPCTNKAIIYNVFMISSLICNQIKKFIRKEEVPFELMMDLQSLTLMKF